MKKIIGLLVVIVALQGCKKNQPATAPLPMLKASTCITLSDYDKLTSNNERAEWLVAQGSMVCDSILYAREVEHEVKATEVKVSSSATPYKMTWGDLKEMVGSNVYRKYVGFRLEPNGDVSKLLLVPGYVENGNTYSVPLFRSIALKYNFSDDAELEFVPAIVKDEMKIVIRFKDKDGIDMYYDFGTLPI